MGQLRWPLPVTVIPRQENKGEGVLIFPLLIPKADLTKIFHLEIYLIKKNLSLQFWPRDAVLPSNSSYYNPKLGFLAIFLLHFGKRELKVNRAVDFI